jgi:predicted nucleic acid-binding protein
MKYLIDTSIVIDALRQSRPLLKDLNDLFIDAEGRFYISAVTIAELFSGKSAQGSIMRKSILDLISVVEVIVLEKEIAIIAGTLRCSNDITLADAMIAASAQFIRATLITRDKVFERVSEIEAIIV